MWAAFYYTVRCKRIKENLIFNHVAINYPLSLEFASCHSNEEKIICCRELIEGNCLGNNAVQREIYNDIFELRTDGYIIFDFKIYLGRLISRY